MSTELIPLDRSTLSATLRRKFIEPPMWAHFSAGIKAEGGRLATLNGSFDLLHAGHLHILFEASKQADYLFVALNSDGSYKKYKHPQGPLIPLQERLELIAALACVDFVTYFEESDPIAFLTEVRPHVHVNGSEYGEGCVEADTVRAGGGELFLVERIPGLSTTAIVDKIKRMR